MLATKPDVVSVPTDGIHLEADLAVPDGARAVVLCAHGSGESRQRARTGQVAERLWDAGLATLLVDLLTPDEQLLDERTAEVRLRVDLLARRAGGVVDWLASHERTRALRIGAFGVGAGAAAALATAAERANVIAAVVSRGGRLDPTAGLERVVAPTLLIVGGHDDAALEVNQRALAVLSGDKQLRIVPRAGRLFEEPGALDEVARLARGWFECYLAAPSEMELPTGELVRGH